MGKPVGVAMTDLERAHWWVVGFLEMRGLGKAAEEVFAEAQALMLGRLGRKHLPGGV